MESGEKASPKRMPKDAQMMAEILKDMEIQYFALQIVTTILNDAKIHAKPCYDSYCWCRSCALATQCCSDHGPSTPTMGTQTPQTMSVSAKIGTRTSLTRQRIAVQIPISKFSAVKASIPAISAVQNVLINPSPVMFSLQNTTNDSSKALKQNVKMVITVMTMATIIYSPTLMHVTCILGLETIVLKFNMHIGCFTVVLENLNTIY
ncbi:unnamed protein product [Nyctereutes procyonoides]|uniref:(raccoon dog) hypothetical protein n=1 Tax=Nyctereutes procyonoides TaxID=34880 RepID=A0A811Z6N7_NYCPR|nr:unnamed protein product [Nyctereutes procyonoides]